MDNQLSNTIYYFDIEFGVYQGSAEAVKIPDSNSLEVPANAVTSAPKLNVPAFDDDVLKPISWRQKNKVARWIWDSEMTLSGHWGETYFVPEPYYKTDENQYFLGELSEGGCFDDPPDLPFMAPPKVVRLPKWDKDSGQWIEGNKKVILLDDEGFIANNSIDLADVFFSGENYVDIELDDKLIKPKYDKATNTFVEAKDIEELRKEKLDSLKEEKNFIETKLNELSSKVTVIDAYNNLVDVLKLDKQVSKKKLDSNLVQKYFDEFNQLFSLDRKVNELESSINSVTDLSKLYKIDTNLLIK